MAGGQAILTDVIENFPGFPDGISGQELIDLMVKQTEKFGAEIRNFVEVEKVLLDGRRKIIKTDGEDIIAQAIIVASGAGYRRLGIPGEEKFIGRGVSFCATCDGAFFKDKDVLVVGGGDTALTEAFFLTKFVKKLTIVHRRDQLRAVKILQERVFKNEKIDFLWDSVPVEIKGGRSVRSVVVQNKKDGTLEEISTDGIFMAIGIVPNITFVQGLVRLDPNGYIETDENLKSSIDGIYAAGDVRKGSLKQVVAASSDGAVAATSAGEYLESLREQEGAGI
jgi:thioredoxin reductase (NADPH)